jgi:hypothetical protein
MNISKTIPDIYNFDSFEELCNDDTKFNLDVVIFFKNNKISHLYFNEIEVIEYFNKTTYSLLEIRDILKKCKIPKLNNLYKKSKKTPLNAYFRLKTTSNYITLYTHGAFSQQRIEDKTFFDTIWLNELQFYISTKSFEDDDFIKIKIRHSDYNIWGRNLTFNSNIYSNLEKSIPLFQNNKYIEFPIYLEIIYKNIPESYDIFNNISGIPKKISIPMYFPDGRGEIICDMFIRYKTGYTCYILTCILPNGTKINIQQNSKKICDTCTDYSKIYDITLQSKYKSICYFELCKISELLADKYPKKINKLSDFEIRMEDLDIFKNIPSRFTIKVHYKD